MLGLMKKKSWENMIQYRVQAKSNKLGETAAPLPSEFFLRPIKGMDSYHCVKEVFLSCKFL